MGLGSRKTNGQSPLPSRATETVSYSTDCLVLSSSFSEVSLLASQVYTLIVGRPCGLRGLLLAAHELVDSYLSIPFMDVVLAISVSQYLNRESDDFV